MGHCRNARHLRANRHFGGVGMLINRQLYELYVITMICDNIDGVMGVLFSDKCTGLKFIVFAVYLPPEDSPWGRNADNFFSYLLSQMYIFSDVDHVFICGDVNARIGNSLDYMPDVDELRDRKVIDSVKNKHGEISYLKASWPF